MSQTGHFGTKTVFFVVAKEDSMEEEHSDEDSCSRAAGDSVFR